MRETRERENRERETRERGEKREDVSLRGWQAYRKEKKSKVSVYVNNLPATLDKFGLRGIFSEAGKVVDTYIPVGRRRGYRHRYGFVRYASNYAAERSLQLFNNKVIRGHKI